MRKKKILIFSDCFTYSGSENVIENILLSDRIKERFDLCFLYGYNESYSTRFKERAARFNIDQNVCSPVNLISPEWYVHQYNLHQTWNIKKVIFLLKVLILKFLKLSFLSHIFNYFKLKCVFKKISPDYIYINNGGYPASLQCCLAVLVARNSNIKKVFFNINNMAVPRMKWYDATIDQYLNAHVDRFITASYAAQNQAVQVRSLNRDLFVRIPNTIFNDEDIQSHYSAEQEIFNSACVFGSVGLLTRRKGYHVLLQAARLLIEDYGISGFKIRLLGNGEEEQSLKNYVNLHHLEKTVEFLGFKSEPMADLNQFDVFVLPSIQNEDFPYVVLEAMILAKPILGTAVAGIPEQIIDGETGYVVPPNDVEALAKQMILLMNSRESLSDIGKRSRAKYFEEFNYSRIEDLYLNILTN